MRMILVHAGHRSINTPPFSATPRWHFCVQQSNAASPVLRINPSKPIMLLRRRRHCSLAFSTACCQRPLAVSTYELHPVRDLSSAVLQQHVSHSEGRSRAVLLEEHCRFWQTSPHSAGNPPEPGIKNVSPPFEARQPVSKDADGAAQKSGLT